MPSNHVPHSTARSTPWRARPKKGWKNNSDSQPLTALAMERIAAYLDNPKAVVTKPMIAQAIGTPRQVVYEHMAGSRSAPGTERLLEYMVLIAMTDPAFKLEDVFRDLTKSFRKLSGKRVQKGAK